MRAEKADYVVKLLVPDDGALPALPPAPAVWADDEEEPRYVWSDPAFDAPEYVGGGGRGGGGGGGGKWARTYARDRPQLKVDRALDEVRAISLNARLTDALANEACTVFDRAVRRVEAIGAVARALPAASVFVACKRAGFPRSMTEVEAASGVPRADIQRANRALISADLSTSRTTKASDFVPRFCSRAGIDSPKKVDAISALSTKIESDGRVPGCPASIAAGAMSIVSGRSAASLSQSCALTPRPILRVAREARRLFGEAT